MQWKGKWGEEHGDREAEYLEGFDVCQNRDKNKMWWKQREEMTNSYEIGQEKLTEAPMSQVSPGRWLQFCQEDSGVVGLMTCFVPGLECVLLKYLLNGLSEEGHI